MSNRQYSGYLIKNRNDNEAFRRLVEISSSISRYENDVKNNYFAAEIYDLTTFQSIYPKWNHNASFYRDNKDFFIYDFLLRKFNIRFVYNDILIFCKHFPIHQDDESENNKGDLIYRLFYYKKMLDFGFLINKESFFLSFFEINFYLFIILILLLSYPTWIFKKRFEYDMLKKAEKKSLENIKNLIEHELVNQENILKYPDKIDRALQVALHHNTVAQMTLKSSKIEDLDPQETLNKVLENLPSNGIKIHKKIDIRNKVIFEKTTLYLAFNTILKNAIHESVGAKNIYINITQSLFWNPSRRIHFEISNDGNQIPLDNRERIFQGFTSKTDGHGIGLKNLKEILRLSGSNLRLLDKSKTTFAFELLASKIKIERKSLQNLDNNKEITSFEVKPSQVELLPWVIILEDSEQLWNGWKLKMTDAKLHFFKSPEDLFYFIDEERLSGRNFLENVSLIISDYDFGHGLNFVNSNVIGGIESENDFKGKIILSTGFNIGIKNSIPDFMQRKISLYYQKRPTSYESLLLLIDEENRFKNFLS